MSGDPRFDYRPDPDRPGWMIWSLRDATRFNSVLDPVRVRREAGDRVRVRMEPRPLHGNLGGAVHGGAQLAFIDIALFAAARALDVVGAGGAVTLDLATQFVAPGALDRPLDAVVEMLRETGRLVFLRGLLVQGDDTVASFTGTIRKGPATP